MQVDLQPDTNRVIVTGNIPTGQKLVSEILVEFDECFPTTTSKQQQPIYARPIAYEITVSKGWTVTINNQNFTEGQIIGQYQKTTTTKKK